MPRTSRGYTRDRRCERERRRERGRAPCLRRRQRPDLQDAICRHRSAWKTCSACGASTTSKARSHTTSVNPFIGNGGDGSNKKHIAAFVSDAVRGLCPREPRFVVEEAHLCRKPNAVLPEDATRLHRVYHNQEVMLLYCCLNASALRLVRPRAATESTTNAPW